MVYSKVTLLKFQSTPPIRVATLGRFCVVFFPQFQSTPPIRVATSVRSILVVLLLISIHATHTGGDIPIVYDKALDRLFQSTPPIRVATKRPAITNKPTAISIHATHTGGDPLLPDILQSGGDFNPRHPYGWRRPYRLLSANNSYFNPRHPYGWRLYVII